MIDLRRAYRHFSVCPLDWPLLVLHSSKGYYFDRSIPFGARMSSYVMQTISQFIVRALALRGITTLLYLDDILCISKDEKTAQAQYAEISEFLTTLGLTLATNKAQPPARHVTWLGINIDLEANRLSIPQQKLDKIKDSLAEKSKQKTLSQKDLWSAAGLINHLAKVVRPARMFMGPIKADASTHADFAWFGRYLADYNGKHIIPDAPVSKVIAADACLKGGGASDGMNCYMHAFTRRISEAHHISQLEIMNCMAATRAFVSEQDSGSRVILQCDNSATVEAINRGRARDPVMAACAHAIWFHAAKLDVDIVCEHVPGELMFIPDTFSRASVSQEYKLKADDLIEQLSLDCIVTHNRMYNYAMFL